MEKENTNNTNGFIVLHRKMMDWEWYKDPNTFTVFLHLLFSVNWKDGRYMGTLVPRGTLVTSYKHLAENCGLSIQNVRTALSHLESTGEITRKSTNRWQSITVVNWAKYQDKDSTDNKQLTINQQTTNNQLTTIEQSNKGTREHIYSVPETFSSDLQESVRQWQSYKKERKEPYKETGWKNFIGWIRNEVSKKGEQAVIDAIIWSMSSNYKGIYYPRQTKSRNNYPQRKAPELGDDFFLKC